MNSRTSGSFAALAVAVLTVAALGIPAIKAGAAGDPCAAPANPVVKENCLPGTPASEWDVSGSGDATIQGFATQMSVDVGTTVHFKVDSTASAYSIDIYRIGYYGGDGARLVTTVSPSATLPQAQPDCLTDADTGLIDCGNWAESASWAVPATAVSGVYFAKLTRTDTSGASQIPFVVRNDSSQSDLLFQTSDTTWEAYNSYGGNSLYTGGPGTNPGRAYKVSYNRPFTTRGTGPEDFFFNAEYPMVRWLESNGYDVSYLSGLDVDRGPASLLEQHKVFLSVGHDEYWSGSQRANVEAARDAGVNLAFFSGNQTFWKTRWEPSIDESATAGRTLVSYKETHAQAKIDPNPQWTGTWRDPLGAGYDAGRPENALAGTIFTVNCCTSAIQVPATDMPLRLWRDTRLARLEGQTATLADSTLGYEWNSDLDNGARPPGQIDLSSTTVSSPQVLQDAGSTYAAGTATHSVTMHRAPSGALVFDVGTVQWSWGLDGNHDRGNSTPDPAMQQATVNVLADMTAQPATLQPGLVAATASTDTSPPTATITSPGAGDTFLAGSPSTVAGSAADVGGGRVAGVEVSVDNGVNWHPASGHESWTYTFTPESTGPLTILARATDDSVNTGPDSAPVSVTVAPHGCPCSIWDNSAQPATTGQNDGLAIDYGVKFRSDVAGDVSGFRFYKSPGDTGTHTGNLWTKAGTLLASATFSAESASGWQEVALAAPVSISANTTYVTSIFSSAGVYAFDPSYFANHGVDNAPLHALAEGFDGNNAVYHEGPTDAFPDSSFGSANYWADVVFSTGPDTTPPVITSRAPAPSATGVATSASVSVTFNEPMDPATITTSTFELRDGANAVVPASVTYQSATRTARLTPNATLSPSANYTARVLTGITDVAGNLLAPSSWSFSSTAPPADSGPGGPILVIASTANPFGRYYGEILSAEGLDEYNVTDITKVTSALLTQYDVVILSDIAVSAAQATMLDNWVNAGGRLVAMHPDAKLAGLLGLTSTGGSASNAYLRVDTSASPGQGITNQTMQYHGSADDYQLSGASAIATLYSDATTATAFPAVTLHSVGASGGQAAAFTYDLARSVVYTRQGNPAWSGQERDGQAPIRSDDLFFGASATDPQPDWVDLSKVAIPQADEQQRLLANLVEQLESTRMPLPRFWYLPRGDKAAVVLTGDDHANGGTAGRFDAQIADSTPGCNVANWECVRSTSYIYPGTPLTDAQAASYDSQGFEIGLHVTTGCADWTPTSLANAYNSQLASWHAQLPSLPSPVTSRTHCIVESDYSTQPHVELANGIRLDTNYYYWPPGWVQDHPGLFTGSGFPMRFADPDGSPIDVYQATTQMTDESGQSYPATIDTLLDNATGPLGYYGVFTANMHTDSATSSGADAIVASAQARNVPVVSARQMLQWLDGRNASSFGNLSWSGDVLGFDVTAGAGANGLEAMLPLTTSDGAPLTAITRGATSVPFTTQTIKGVAYAMFTAPTGTYSATYTADTTAPVISAVAASATVAGNATVTWTTDESSSSTVAYGTDPASLAATKSDATNVTGHSVTLPGLVPGTTYYFRVTATDRAGNSSTSPAPPAGPASFAVPTFVAADTTTADFTAGAPAGCVAVAHSGDGELELAPALSTEFAGTTLPSGWTSTPFVSGGAATVSGGQLQANGTLVGTTSTYAAGRSLEFVATFSNESFEHAGFATDLNAAPWAIFSTGSGGTSLLARTNGGSSSTDTDLGASLLGAPHRFRIDWTASKVVYSVDGAQVASHSIAISTAMRPVLSDAHADATNLAVDWLQMSPFGSGCSFVSRTIDGGTPRRWETLVATKSVPANTAVQLLARSSNDASTWSPFLAVSGTTLSVPDGRYLQYRSDLSTSDPTATPLLTSVAVSAIASPLGVPSTPAVVALNASALVLWTAPTNTGPPITGYVVTPYIGTVAQTAVTFASTATSETVPALVNGTAYTFRVAAKTASGTGPQTGASPAVTIGAPTPPSTPAVVAGNASATLSWTAPSTNGSAITGYVVTPFIASVAQTPVTFASTATSQTVTGLVSGTAYTFRVAAKNANGTGVQSLASAATTVGAPVAPAPPTAVAGSSSVTVTWVAPISNGSPITGYVVTPFVGTTARTAVTFASTATTQTVTGLVNGTVYTFKVAAKNANGTGAESPASAAVTAGIPAAPAAPTAVPGNVSAKVSWTAPGNNGSAITGYVVTPFVGTTAGTAVTFASTATTQTVTGLVNGTVYTFKVAARNAKGTSPLSPASAPVTVGVPAAPAAPTVASGDGTAIVSWVAPANNGTPITGYVVTPFVGTTAGTPVTFASTAITQTMTGLVNGTTYTFEVAAKNAKGTSPASAASAALTVGAPTAPAAPTVVAGNGSVTLSWVAPANNGSAITGYVVTPFIGTVAQTSVSFASTATTQHITGLTNGTTYTFRVAARNVRGVGLRSAASATAKPLATLTALVVRK